MVKNRNQHSRKLNGGTNARPNGGNKAKQQKNGKFNKEPQEEKEIKASNNIGEPNNGEHGKGSAKTSFWNSLKAFFKGLLKRKKDTDNEEVEIEAREQASNIQENNSNADGISTLSSDDSINLNDDNADDNVSTSTIKEDSEKEIENKNGDNVEVQPNDKIREVLETIVGEYKEEFKFETEEPKDIITSLHTKVVDYFNWKKLIETIMQLLNMDENTDYNSIPAEIRRTQQSKNNVELQSETNGNNKSLEDDILSSIRIHEKINKLYTDSKKDDDFVNNIDKLFTEIEKHIGNYAIVKRIRELQGEALSKYFPADNSSLNEGLGTLIEDLNKDKKENEEEEKQDANNTDIESSSEENFVQKVIENVNQSIPNCLDNKANDVSSLSENIINKIKVLSEHKGLEQINENNTNVSEQDEEGENKLTVESGSQADLTRTIRKVIHLANDVAINEDTLTKAIESIIAHTKSQTLEDFSSKLEGININLENPQESAIAINEAIAAKKEMQSFCRDLEIRNLNEAKQKIEKERDEIICQNMLTPLDEDIRDKIKGKSSETPVKISNALARLVKEANSNLTIANSTIQEMDAAKQQLLVSVCEGYKELSGKDLDSQNIKEALSSYFKEVSTKLNKAAETKEHLEGHITELEQVNDQLTSTINATNASLDNIVAKNKLKQNDNVNVISEVLKATFIRPCDPRKKDQGKVLEKALRDAVDEFNEKFTDGTQSESDFFNWPSILEKLIEEDLSNENGMINLIARYYAYSCLPFMTDKNRQYGVRIDHSIMTKVFNIMCQITDSCGIQLIIPLLFSERVEDGDYEDFTGKKYSDLDNWNADAKNQIENITNSEKNGYIIDIIQVGYRLNGEVKQKAKVIL